MVFGILLCAAAVLSGCGGGGTGLLNINRTGTLTTSDRLNIDGSYGDVVHFTASRDGWIEVSMDSEGSNPVFDPFVVVWWGDADDFTNPGTWIGEDDDSGGGNNAWFSFYANDGERYTAMFTTYGPGDLGTYRYRIVEVDTMILSPSKGISKNGKPALDPNSKRLSDGSRSEAIKVAPEAEAKQAGE
jgi:hypothetical protein